MTLPVVSLDIVSDVSCPWCAIGLQSLRQAVAQVQDELTVTWQFHPFELNPQAPPGGVNLDAYLSDKYGSTIEQVHERRAQIRERAAQLGLEFRQDADSRAYNTFNAHRLLHWAGLPGQPEGAQLALKQALFVAYFTEGRDPGDPDVLHSLAAQCGLDAARAAEVLAGDEHAEDVRQAEAFWQAQGIQSVPAIVLDRRYLVSGGQPVAVFVQALRSCVTGSADG